MVLFLGRCNLVCFGMGMVCLKGDKEPDTSTFPEMVTELLYCANLQLDEGGHQQKKKALVLGVHLEARMQLLLL